MSYVISDSEVEETVQPRIAVQPRRVSRPLPTRVEIGSSESEEEDDEDESFFRRRGPAEAASAGEQSSQVPTQSSGYIDIGDSLLLDESDASEDEESSASQTNKHILESNGDEEQEVRKRARSVSLTPPPELPEKRQPTKRRMSVVDVDTISVPAMATPPRSHQQPADLSGLDPALRAAIMSGNGDGSSTGSPCESRFLQGDVQPSSEVALSPAMKLAEKVTLEFDFIFDEAFMDTELPALWDKTRWRRTRITNKKAVDKRLRERLAIQVFATDPIEKALRVYASNFAVDVMRTSPILMSDSIRVFPTSSVLSLGAKPIFYIKVYPRNVFSRTKASETIERMQRETEYRQAQSERERMRELYGDNVDTSVLSQAEAMAELDESLQADTPASGDQDGAGTIRIKIRDREGRDTLLRVAPTTVVQTIIDHYRQIAKLPESTTIVLEFDDERLEPGVALADTEIEDDDMLTAISK
ncbi:hypothetical protein EC988_003139 [Linderina pennispora]|nr:hypothetical protein EC988_003139 [Linderina pennispora]